MENFVKQFDELLKRLQEEERRIPEIGPDLLPTIRQQKQDAARQALLARAGRELSAFRERVATRLADVQRQFRKATYPAMTSPLASERTFGSEEFQAAESFSVLFPDEGFTRRQFALDRRDFVACLADRAERSKGANPDAGADRRKFLRTVNELFSPLWGTLPDEEKDLQRAQAMAEKAAEAVKVGQIAVLPHDAYPGSFAPSILTREAVERADAG